MRRKVHPFFVQRKRACVVEKEKFVKNKFK